jgi:hypothetical protein
MEAAKTIEGRTMLWQDARSAGDRLPHDHGPESCCKQVRTILIRARMQAVFGIFRHPVTTRR